MYDEFLSFQILMHKEKLLQKVCCVRTVLSIVAPFLIRSVQDCASNLLLLERFRKSERGFPLSALRFEWSQKPGINAQHGTAILPAAKGLRNPVS